MNQAPALKITFSSFFFFATSAKCCACVRLCVCVCVLCKLGFASAATEGCFYIPSDCCTFSPRAQVEKTDTQTRQGGTSVTHTRTVTSCKYQPPPPTPPPAEVITKKTHIWNGVIGGGVRLLMQMCINGAGG